MMKRGLMNIKVRTVLKEGSLKPFLQLFILNHARGIFSEGNSVEMILIILEKFAQKKAIANCVEGHEAKVKMIYEWTVRWSVDEQIKTLRHKDIQN